MDVIFVPGKSILFILVEHGMYKTHPVVSAGEKRTEQLIGAAISTQDNTRR